MNLLNQLRAARESYTVKLRQFVRIFTKSPTVLVCFFEGEDVKYYGPRIEILKPTLKWEAIDCCGKDSAIKLWQLINNHSIYSAAKTAYFFDKDFDDATKLPSGDNIYVTPCYSVENLYVTESTTKRILRAEFGISEQPDEDGIFAKCIGLFKCRLIEFLDAIELANAWILFHRQAEANTGAQTRLNLASLNPGKMVTVTLHAATRTYTLFDLEVAVGNARTVSEADLNSLAKTFDRVSRHLAFRGKFQAYFMRAFLNRLQNDANADVPTFFPKKRRLTLTVSDRNFLSDLTQHADTPDCLRRFIDSLK